MAGMTRREIAFLLIGLGFGLSLAMMGITAVLLSLYKSSLITGYGWDEMLIVLPVVLLAIGVLLLVYQPKRGQISN
jgi:hypothetical protein